MKISDEFGEENSGFREKKDTKESFFSTVLNVWESYLRGVKEPILRFSAFIALLLFLGYLIAASGSENGAYLFLMFVIPLLSILIVGVCYYFKHMSYLEKQKKANLRSFRRMTKKIELLENENRKRGGSNE